MGDGVKAFGIPVGGWIDLAASGGVERESSEQVGTFYGPSGALRISNGLKLVMPADK